MRYSKLTFLVGLFFFILYPRETAMQYGSGAYIRNLLTNEYNTLQPLLTVGDAIPRLAGTFGSYTPSTAQYAMSGVPDGLGVYHKPSGGYYVYMNHENASGQVTLYRRGGTSKVNGARVSLFEFDENWQPIGGKNLIERLKVYGLTWTLNPTSGTYQLAGQSDRTLSRFCSGSLAESGFYDLSGNPAPIWFAPEEKGDGRGWALYPDGTAFALAGLGRYSKEQVLSAGQYRGENNSQTVLLVTEDNGDGELYLYLGTQTSADPNGFESGQLYVLRVENTVGNGFDNETMPLNNAQVARWVAVANTVDLNNASALSSWANQTGNSTNFRRIEDIGEDPTQLGTFYFVTTGTSDGDNPYGKMYRLQLNTNNPVANGEITLVLEGGTTTGVSYDNLTVDLAGNVWIQENATADGVAVLNSQQRYARVLRWEIATGNLTHQWEMNLPAIDPANQNNYTSWEASGIVPLPDSDSAYLMTIQAHTIPDADFLEGGQLILVRRLLNQYFLPLIMR